MKYWIYALLKRRELKLAFFFSERKNKGTTFWGFDVFLSESAPKCVISARVHMCAHKCTACIFAHIDAEEVYCRVNADILFFQASGYFLSSLVRWMI